MTKLSNKVTFTFPKTLGCADYHGLSDYADVLSELTGQKVKFMEVCYLPSTENYVGVFYIKKDKATYKMIADLIALERKEAEDEWLE